MTHAAITAEGLRQRYGGTQAVDGVTFEVARGEFFGILGPNGAGKTTTLEMVEGLRRADEGRAHLLGVPSWPRDPALLRRVGVQQKRILRRLWLSPASARSVVAARVGVNLSVAFARPPSSSAWPPSPTTGCA